MYFFLTAPIWSSLCSTDKDAVKSLPMLVKKMYILAVLVPNGFYSSHFSGMELEEYTLNCHKNIHKVWFKSKCIMGLLKM